MCHHLKGVLEVQVQRNQGRGVVSIKQNVGVLLVPTTMKRRVEVQTKQYREYMHESRIWCLCHVTRSVQYVKANPANSALAGESFVVESYMAGLRS